MNHPPASPSHFVRIEAEALAHLAQRLEAGPSDPLSQALEATLTLLSTQKGAGHRIALTGIGKSGLIARKIAATLNSTGSPAYFLHPTEALHGDLGIVSPADPILVLSYSGETEEILRLLPAFGRLALPIISLTGCLQSSLARASAITLDVSIYSEACPLNLAPTASTTVMLALGDAIALELARRANFQPLDFAALHPGGPLGRRLAQVRDLMHSGDALPQVAPAALLPELIHEMSRKKLGMTTVLTSESTAPILLGIISDGDLRRLFERVGPLAFERTAADIMNPNPHTIAPTASAAEALTRMETHKITSLVVVEEDQVQGVIHLHDLWQPPSPVQS